MDTQKTIRKYLWYELIANLCFGLVAMINNIDNAMKANELKTIASTVGLINVIVFVVFTIKGRRLMSKYYDSELNRMGIFLPSIKDENFQELLDKAQEKLKSCTVDGIADKLSEDYMKYNLILTTITMLFVFFQMVISNMRFEFLLAFTIVLEFGFIFNMILEYKFSRKMKGDNNDKEQKSPQVDK